MSWLLIKKQQDIIEVSMRLDDKLLVARQNTLVVRPILEGLASFGVGLSGVLGKDGVENKPLAGLGIAAALSSLVLRGVEMRYPVEVGKQRIRAMIGGSFSIAANLMFANILASDWKVGLTTGVTTTAVLISIAAGVYIEQLGSPEVIGRKRYGLISANIFAGVGCVGAIVVGYPFTGPGPL